MSNFKSMHQHIERFLSKVQKTDNCWLWLGLKHPNGYPRFTVSTKNVWAHRFSYATYNGALIDGMQIDHLCRNPLCVNPKHLEQVSPRENTLRSTNLAAQNARKQECIRGHAYDDTNTRFSKNGKHRHCRICERARVSRYYWANKAKLELEKEKRT